MKKKTTIYLDEADRKAIAIIKQRYGITSDSDAIRFALRIVSEQEEKKSVHKNWCSELGVPNTWGIDGIHIIDLHNLSLLPVTLYQNM